MKMTRREFLLWLGGLCSLGLLGWLVGRKLQTPPEPVAETPFEPPHFAVRPKHALNGISFQVDRAKRTICAERETDGVRVWESHGEDKFIVPGAAFPLHHDPLDRTIRIAPSYPPLDLGFKSSKIRNILQKQNVWLTVIGIGAGLYVGWAMLYVICTTVSDTLDMFPIINIPTYIISIVGTFMVSVIVNFMFSGKVKTIDMVDALKGVE